MNAFQARVITLTRCGLFLFFLFAGHAANAQGTILGVGTEFLLGNDLTDPENDGDPEADVNYNAIFRANDEEGFGGGESAFNVFDNEVGGGNAKWCCGLAGGFPEDVGLWIEAELQSPPAFLTHFTVTSGNDTPGRDPIHFTLSGSNDGVNYETIYELDVDETIWTERNQVIQFSSPDDFPTQDTAYQTFRFSAFDSANNPDGAYFQFNELELFGGLAAEVVGDFNGDGEVNFSDFTILSSNFRNTGTKIGDGDANRDGTVDLRDFVIFRDAFQSGAGEPVAAVPEPSSYALLMFASVIGLFCRRKSSQR